MARYLLCAFLCFGVSFPYLSNAQQATLEEEAEAFEKRGVPSRFLAPWQDVPHLKLPTLNQARHRVLYSPLRIVGSEGIGHGFATKNMEVTAAIRLGLAYTHRRPVFGSLSLNNPMIMEEFFGWGDNELSGKLFHESNCEPSPPPNPETVSKTMKNCEMCASVRNQPTGPMRLNMRHLVSIPERISLPYRTNVNQSVHDLLSRYNEPHTIFQVGEERCGSYPIHVDFSLSRPWFYWKYWNKHTILPNNIAGQKRALFGDFRTAAERANVSYEPSSASLQVNPLEFRDKELTIAVHVRRGDFFQASNRKMIRDSAYVQIIRTVQDIVEEAGGPFARMPVAVYIYSEGKPKEGHQHTTHIRSKLTREYQDISGTVRDGKWWQDLLSKQHPQHEGRPPSRRGKVLRIPRVELRISRPTVETLHQMMRADVFIGSASGLSTYLVRALARGVQLYPGMPEKTVEAFCCSTGTNWDTGTFDRDRFLAQWKKYSEANAKYVDAKLNSTTLTKLRAAVKLGLPHRMSSRENTFSRSRLGRALFY